MVEEEPIKMRVHIFHRKNPHQLTEEEIGKVETKLKNYIEELKKKGIPLKLEVERVPLSEEVALHSLPEDYKLVLETPSTAVVAKNLSELMSLIYIHYELERLKKGKKKRGS